jgi:hypothetical protein
MVTKIYKYIITKKNGNCLCKVLYNQIISEKVLLTIKLNGFV